MISVGAVLYPCAAAVLEASADVQWDICVTKWILSDASENLLFSVIPTGNAAYNIPQWSIIKQYSKQANKILVASHIMNRLWFLLSCKKDLNKIKYLIYCKNNYAMKKYEKKNILKETHNIKSIVMAKENISI